MSEVKSLSNVTTQRPNVDNNPQQATNLVKQQNLFEELQKQKDDNEELAKQNLQLLQQMKELLQQKKEQRIEKSLQKSDQKNSGFMSREVTLYQDENDDKDLLRSKSRQDGSESKSNVSLFPRRNSQQVVDQNKEMFTRNEAKLFVSNTNSMISQAVKKINESSQPQAQSQHHQEDQPVIPSLKLLTYSPSRTQSQALNQISRTSTQNSYRQSIQQMNPGLPPQSHRHSQRNSTDIQTQRNGTSSGSSTYRGGQSEKRGNNINEKNYIRSMLQNSILQTNEEKIDFLVSEIETANTKISILQEHLQTLISTKSTQPSQPDNSSFDLQPLLNQINILTQENQKLKMCITERTKEANNTILKLSTQNKDLSNKNQEYLALIEQLSSELIKLQQQQMQGHTFSFQASQIPQTPSQLSLRQQQHYEEEMQDLRQENLKLSADLKALTVRFDELVRDKTMVEQTFEQMRLKEMELQEQVHNRDQVIKKLKKKIVTQYLKERLTSVSDDPDPCQIVTTNSPPQHDPYNNIPSHYGQTETEDGIRMFSNTVLSDSSQPQISIKEHVSIETALLTVTNQMSGNQSRLWTNRRTLPLSYLNISHNPSESGTLETLFLLFRMMYFLSIQFKSLQTQPLHKQTALGLSLNEVIFGNGKTSLQIDSKMLTQLWKICVESQANENTSIFEGQMEMKVDCTKGYKQMQLNFDSFTSQTEYSKKIDGTNVVKYSVKYSCSPTQPIVSKKQIALMCHDLFKHIKNENCNHKFYLPQMAQALDKSSLDASKFATKLCFEADTMNLSMWDYCRVRFALFADQIQHKLIVSSCALVPHISYSFYQIPKMKLVSTPLCRLLIGKQTKEDEKMIQTNFVPGGTHKYSGFLSLDDEKRLYPLMPNDPLAYSTPIIGMWFYGVDDFRSSYVWSVCSRFVFCRNIKKKSCATNVETFIVVVFSAKHQVQFLQMKIDSSVDLQGHELKNNWVILTHTESINREPNLFFKPYTVKNFTNLPIYVFGNYLTKLKQLQIANKNQSSSNSKTSQQRRMSANREDHATQSKMSKDQQKQVVNPQQRARQQQALSANRENTNQANNQKFFPNVTSQFTLNTSGNLDQQQDQKPEKKYDFLKYQEQNEMHEQVRNNISVSSHSSKLNRSRNSQSKNRNQDQEEEQEKQANSNFKHINQPLNQFYPLSKQNLEALSKPKQSSQLNLGDMGNVQENIKSDELPNINATPRSKQHFVNQNKQIQSLQLQVQMLQQQMLEMRQMFTQQQASGLNTQYQSTASQSKYNSMNIVPQQVQYQSNLYQEVNIPPLISQPTAEFAFNNINQQPSYKEMYELGQIETLGRLDQKQQQMQINEQDHEDDHSQSDNSLQESEIPLPGKNLGAKRSRNQRKTKQDMVFPRQNTQQVLNQNILNNFQDIHSSQTISENHHLPSCGTGALSNSNSRLKRSQSSSNYKSSLMNSSIQELNAIKSNLNKQYEENVISQRPKGSRNVLNNVNKQVKEEKKLQSSSSSSSDDDDRVDHTYNPYSFKKLEQAIFNKKQQQPSQSTTKRRDDITKSQSKKDQLHEDQEDEKPIVLQQIPEHKLQGKSDWTMDLPRIQYAADDEEDDDQEEEDFELSDNDQENFDQKGQDRSEMRLSKLKLNYNDDDSDLEQSEISKRKEQLK